MLAASIKYVYVPIMELSVEIRKIYINSGVIFFRNVMLHLKNNIII